jgi:hypothetical protein
MSAKKKATSETAVKEVKENVEQTFKRIEKLTPEQEAAMPRYVEKWIKIGTDTSRLDYDETLDIVNKVQTQLLGRKATPVVIFDNPHECWVACNYAVQGTPINDLKKAVDKYFDDESVRNSFKMEPFTMPHLTGSFDASLFSFYDFFRSEVKIPYGEYEEKYLIWESTTKLGLIFPLENVCIVSEKPTTVSLNGVNRPHCDGGTAISYAGKGDFNIYMLNGVRVPEWLAVTHSSKIPIERYTELKNADVKMEFVRKVGIERLLEKGRKIDDHTNYKEEWWTKSEYELWDMNVFFEGVEYAPHLKMLNQTTGVWHVEAVAPECTDLPSAIKWRMGGLDVDIKAIA